MLNSVARTIVRSVVVAARAVESLVVLAQKCPPRYARQNTVRTAVALLPLKSNSNVCGADCFLLLNLSGVFLLSLSRCEGVATRVSAMDGRKRVRREIDRRRGGGII